MKKVILAFEGSNFSEAAFGFARKLNQLQPVLLTGVFLPQAMLANLWSYAGAGSGAQFIPMIEAEESALVHQNIGRFEKLCQANNIEYRVHKDFYDFALPELKQESLYADLVILGSQAFYVNPGTHEVSEYLAFALKDMKCPVVLVPDKFDFPQSIILAYDGSENSVFAIKQFAYLFPELTHLPTLLVYADDEPGKDFPEKILIEELTARHFNNLTLFKLEINPKKYFSTWVMEKKTALLVGGSYGKRGVAGLFKKHFLKDVIAEHQLPLFVAHK